MAVQTLSLTVKKAFAVYSVDPVSGLVVDEHPHSEDAYIQSWIYTVPPGTPWLSTDNLYMS